MSDFKTENSHKAAKPMVWVKGHDGTTYICPKSAIKDPGSVSEAELRECMDESQNPQNN